MPRARYPTPHAPARDGARHHGPAIASPIAAAQDKGALSASFGDSAATKVKSAAATALQVGAGSRRRRARSHRHPLQMGRQYAGHRPRLQRARPLRVPAGDGRHAPAHGEGHQPSRHGRRRWRSATGRSRLFQHAALRVLARRHLSRRQSIRPCPAAGREVEIATLDFGLLASAGSTAARRMAGVAAEASVPALVGEAAAAPLAVHDRREPVPAELDESASIRARSTRGYGHASAHPARCSRSTSRAFIACAAPSRARSRRSWLR